MCIQVMRGTIYALFGPSGCGNELQIFLTHIYFSYEPLSSKGVVPLWIGKCNLCLTKKMVHHGSEIFPIVSIRKLYWRTHPSSWPLLSDKVGCHCTGAWGLMFRPPPHTDKSVGNFQKKIEKTWSKMASNALYTKLFFFYFWKKKFGKLPGPDPPPIFHIL